VGHRLGVCAGLNLKSQPGCAGAWAATLHNAFTVSKLLVLVFALGLVAQAQQGQTMSTIAGGGPPNGLSATTVPIGLPWGVVQDSAGNTYVSDNITHRIFKIDTSAPPKLSVVAGNGAKGFGGDGGLATAATLNGPEGLAIDSNDVLYIADTGNNRIRAVNTSTTTSFEIAGVTIGPLDIATVAGNGQPCALPTGTCGDGSLTTLAQLSSPGGVAIDASGNIFIADTLDNKIREVTTLTGIIISVAGTGNAGPPTNGTATSSDLDAPAGVYVDGSGNIFIADTVNDVVEEVTTGSLKTIVGTAGTACSPSTSACGDGGPALSALLNLPDDVFVEAGNIYIADTNDNRVREVTAGNISTVAGNGVPCVSLTSPTCGDGTATAALLNFPTGIFVNGSGFWIADQNDNGVRNVASNVISRFAGIYFNAGYYGDGGPATSAELLHPSGMNFDSAGNLFVADAQNNAIRKIATNGNISTVAGTGAPCRSLTCGDGGPVASATLFVPSDVALDASGNIYIADTQDNVIRVVNTTASVLKFFAGTANELDVQAGDIETVAGTITQPPCPPPGTTCGDNGPATLAFLNSPSGLFLDKSGNIYIADTGDNVIRFVNTQAFGTPSINIGTVSVAPGNIATIAGNYTACALSTDPCGDGAGAGSANLSTPGSVFVDTAGNVYVVDSGDNKIRVVNPQPSNSITVAGVTINAGDIATIAGNGTEGYSGDGHVATNAELFFPGGVFVDGTDIFIADQVNFVVRVVNSQSGNIQTAVGTGVSGFSGDGGAPLSAELARPISIRGDSSGNLYISDASAGRVRKASNLLATPPAALLSSSSVQFSVQALGTTSTAQYVTVKNSGNISDLVVSSVAISGTNASDFKQTNNCKSVAPSNSCTITVTFTPAAAGTRTATLSITDNAAGSPQTVSLNGNAVVPFTLPTSGTLSPASVSAGGSANATIAITWAGSSTAAVALSCSVSPAPAGAPTCSLSPSSVTPKNGTANSTLTVNTEAATTGALEPSVLHGSGIFAATWLFLPAMVLSTAGMGSSKRKKTLSCLLLILAIAGCIFLVACGGGSSSPNNNGNGGSSGGTPSGQYTITVTATSAGMPAQTEALHLTVQ
jgi:sugar lactone lactonase YvrE